MDEEYVQKESRQLINSYERHAMIDKILNVGDRVEMKRYSLSEVPGEKPKLYNSQLIDITSDSKVNISVPLESGRIVPLEVGGRYELRFITTTGMYVCKAEITNRCRQGNIYYLVMLILSELHKDQRRQYFRLEKIMPMSYHLLTDEEQALLALITEDSFKDDFDKRTAINRLRDYRTENLDGTLSNISAGGIKFQSDRSLTADDLIRVSVLLDELDTEPLDLFAHVIASNHIVNGNMNHEHRIEFFNVNRDTREKIVKYVFNEERKQRNKEKSLF